MKIAATTRKLQGTGASRRLRNSGKTPGIIYGGAATPHMIELDHNNLFHALKKEAFHASILDLEVDGQAQKALLRDYQMHPFKPLVLHIDFERVEANKPVHMKVPLHFSGAENSPAVKLSKALVSHPINEIEVSCLPADLPEFIAVDLSELVAGKSLHVSELKLPKGVTVVTHGSKIDTVIASAILPGGKKDAASEEAPAAAPAPAAAKGAPAPAAAKAPAKK
jgi:large subunit ribosomal protein L25